MIRISNLKKSFLLVSCGVAVVWAVLMLPDSAQASGPAQSVPSYPGRSFSQLELSNARDRMLAINDAFVEIGVVQQDPRITTIVAENRTTILTMDNLGLSVLAQCEPHLIRMQAAVETIRSAIVDARSAATASAATYQDPGCPTNPASAEFPCANICAFVGPPFTEHDCALDFVLREATILVAGSSAIVCDALENVAVVAGFGGNVSVLCAVLDTLTMLAALAWEPFNFEDAQIAAAEAHATYLRQLPIYNGIVALTANTQGSSNISLEGHLKRGDVLASLYLPAAHNGQLNSILDLVTKLITDSYNAGLPLNNSVYFMNLANQEYDAGHYRLAYQRAATAYQLLTE